jgi:hypothetical protein
MKQRDPIRARFPIWIRSPFEKQTSGLMAALEAISAARRGTTWVWL